MRCFELARYGLCLAMVAGLAACATSESPEAPDSLADLVVPDPDFTFATAKTVQIDLLAADGETPAAVEVADAEGRRLMNGAFLGSARIDVKLPVHRADQVEVRIGQGQAAVQQSVSVRDGRATANLEGR